MGEFLANAKEQAHELIERLAPSQVTAVVGLLEAMLDPDSRAIGNAPADEEPPTLDAEKALERLWNGPGRTRSFHTSASWLNLGLPRKKSTARKNQVERLTWGEPARGAVRSRR